MDPYCYENSKVLINNFNIKDLEKLFNVERKYTLLREAELEKENSYNIDLNRYLYIHKYLFSDIYPFAGEIRTVNMKKHDYVFAKHELIKSKLKTIIYQMKKVKVDDSNVGKLLAYFYLKLNDVHAFREGNGRVNREFIREYASYLGYDLDYGNVNKDDLYYYTLDNDMDGVKKFFDKTLGLSKRR